MRRCVHGWVAIMVVFLLEIWLWKQVWFSQVKYYAPVL